MKLWSWLMIWAWLTLVVAEWQRLAVSKFEDGPLLLHWIAGLLALAAMVAWISGWGAQAWRRVRVTVIVLIMLGIVVGGIGYTMFRRQQIEREVLAAEEAAKRLNGQTPPKFVPPLGIFDDLVPERVEVEPPGQPTTVGKVYEDGGLRWEYLGGNQTLRAAWRVTNADGFAVMPRPPAGRDAATIYAVTQWWDHIGRHWRYTGELDSSGNPLVSDGRDQRPVRRASTP